MRSFISIAVAILCVAAVSLAHAQHRALVANGQSLSYVDSGQGPVLVLVHGSISDYREWGHQIEAFAPHFRVIAYSRRYHWPNAPPDKDADATLARQVEDLAALIRNLKIAPAYVIGHSYGGATALLLAQGHPELVRALVLAEPPMGGVLGELSKDDPVSKEGQAVRAAMKDAFSSGNAERIVKTYADRVAPGEYESASAETRQMLLANVAAFELDFSSDRPPFTCTDAQRIAAPTLVLAGGRSALGLQRIASALAKCLRAGTVATIPGATHWMQSDHALAFNEAVLAFLRGR